MAEDNNRSVEKFVENAQVLMDIMKELGITNYEPVELNRLLNLMKEQKKFVSETNVKPVLGLCLPLNMAEHSRPSDPTKKVSSQTQIVKATNSDNTYKNTRITAKKTKCWNGKQLLENVIPPKLNYTSFGVEVTKLLCALINASDCDYETVFEITKKGRSSPVLYAVVEPDSDYAVKVEYTQREVRNRSDRDSISITFGEATGLSIAEMITKNINLNESSSSMEVAKLLCAMKSSCEQYIEYEALFVIKKVNSTYDSFYAVIQSRPPFALYIYT